MISNLRFTVLIIKTVLQVYRCVLMSYGRSQNRTAGRSRADGTSPQLMTKDKYYSQFLKYTDIRHRH